MAFEIGDIVALRSGSEAMTVEKIIETTDGSKKVECVYQDKNGNICRDKFYIETLHSGSHEAETQKRIQQGLLDKLNKLTD